MKTLKDLLALGTILPTLMAVDGVAVAATGEATGWSAGGALRIAQAAPDDDPLHRRPGQPPAAQRPPQPAQPRPQMPAQPRVQPAQPHVQAPPAAARPAPVQERPAIRVEQPRAPVAPRVQVPSPTGTPMIRTAPSAPTVPGRPTDPRIIRAPGRPANAPVAPPAATAPVHVAPPAATAPVHVAPPVTTAPTNVAPSAGAPRPQPPAGVAPMPGGAVPGAPMPSGAGVDHPPQPPMGGPLPPRGEVRPGGPGVGTALGAAAVGAAVGVVGGMMLGGEAHGLGDVQRQRHEEMRDGVTVYSEPGRVIVRDGKDLWLRHDETERFRDLGGDVVSERRGDEIVSVWRRPDGVRVVTVTDPDGRLIRRYREWPDGRREMLIDDGFRPRPARWADRVVVLPPPPVPQDRWAIEADRADETTIWQTLEAPPLAPLPRRYTLDEVRSSRDLRAYMPAIDLDTITFETGSWVVDPSEVGRLERIARGIRRALDRNPDEIFLVEGHTDLVGNDLDNLSLSDRRAQSVATVLSRDFGIPVENLVTQGYGAQFPKEMTTEASQINRRVTVRRITPLLGTAAAP